MQSTVYIATSMDGYIAREDGRVDWLSALESLPGEDYGYQAFFDTVDALVMGRNTFEMVRSFGSWPYGEKPVVVLTSRPLDLAEEFPGDVDALSGSPTEISKDLADRGYRHIYIDGGQTVQDFLRAGLVRTLIISRIPVLIGKGIPLFGELPRDVHLAHLETTSFPNGLVQSHYRVLENKA